MKHTIVLIVAILPALIWGCTTKSIQAPAIALSQDQAENNADLRAMLPRGTSIEDAKQIILAQGYDWELKTTRSKLDGTPTPSNPYAICTKPNTEPVTIAFSSDNTVAIVNILETPKTTKIENIVYSAIADYPKENGRNPNTTEEIIEYILKNNPNVDKADLGSISLITRPNGKKQLRFNPRDYAISYVDLPKLQ